MWKAITRVLVLMGLLLGVMGAGAIEGDLDATFGSGGIAPLEPAYSDLKVSNPVVQRDGKILVCRSGLANYDPVENFGLVHRLTKSGSPDPGFGQGGSVELEGSISGNEAPCGIGIQHDGRIIVYVRAIADLDAPIRQAVTRLFRLNVDGSRDDTFAGGLSHIDLLVDGSATATAIAIQPDDAIVIGLGMTRNRFGVARFGRDGMADGSFGKNGFVDIQFPRVMLSFQSVDNVFVDSQQRIVVTGSIATDPVGRQLFAAARLLGNGAADLSYANRGQVTVDFTELSAGAHVGFLQSGDRVVLAGMTETNWSPSGEPSLDRIGVARLLDNGQLDSSFGIGGKSIVPIDGATYGIAFAGLSPPSGGSMLAGRTSIGEQTHALMVALDESGNLRADFGANGVRIFDELPNESAFFRAALQGDDYVIVGSIFPPFPKLRTDFVARIKGVPFSRRAPTRPLPPILAELQRVRAEGVPSRP